MWDQSGQHFSVVNGLEAADDCRLGTSVSWVDRQSRRKTSGGSLRILPDGVGNGEVLHCLRVSRSSFVFEVRVSFSEPSDPAVDDVDGSGALPNALFMLRTAAPVPQCHLWKMAARRYPCGIDIALKPQAEHVRSYTFSEKL